MAVNSVFFYSLFNITCAISIVLLNKWVYVNVGFPNITLTLLHFAFTFLGLEICERYNVFNVKTASLRDMLSLAASFCGFVIFTNLSLQYNTVGTYQLAKVLTTPTIALIQERCFGRTVSKKIKCTLVCITAGVIVAVMNDIKFNLWGTCYATVGVLITSCYQILVGRKQSELQMDHMQLLYYQSFISSAMLVPVVMVLEPPWETLARAISLLDIVMILLTCIIAFFLNLSIYWIIGSTSPLTYNMVGHLKFCLTAAGGYLIFNEPLTVTQIIGVVLTLTGVTAYGQIKYKEKELAGKSLEV